MSIASLERYGTDLACAKVMNNVPSRGRARTDPPAEPRRDTDPFVTLAHDSTGLPVLDGVRSSATLCRSDRTRVVLVSLRGEQPGAVFRIEPPNGIIGRASTADVVLGDATVSWEHARVVIEGGDAFVEDLSSRNGTFVNERRIFARTALIDGDYLSVGGGSTLFKFSMMGEFEEGVLRTLFDLAQRDPLTGLYNRRYFDDRLNSEFLFAQRHLASLGLLFIDVDRFKRVNDLRGHPMGDAVLKLVARSVQKMMRPEDVLSRYGGEEFVAIVRASSLRNLEILGTRICHRIEALAFVLSSQSAGVTVSVGVSCMDDGRRCASAAALLASADSALYEAKAGGGNRVFIAAALSPPGPYAHRGFE